jgi:hypothetical protein
MLHLLIITLLLIRRILLEAANGTDAFSFRLMFVQILLYGKPTKPEELFEKFWEHMVGKYSRNKNLTEEELKARIKRFLARKMKYNNATLDSKLFVGVDLDVVDNDPAEDEEGGVQVPIPERDEIEGLFIS